MPVRWNTERKADLIVSWERARKTEFQSQAELFEAVASRLDRLHGTVDFTPRACQDMWRNIYRQHWPGYAYAHNRDRAMTAYSGIYAFRFDRAPALGEAVNESLREARMPLLGAKLVLRFQSHNSRGSRSKKWRVMRLNSTNAEGNDIVPAQNTIVPTEEEPTLSEDDQIAVLTQREADAQHDNTIHAQDGNASPGWESAPSGDDQRIVLTQRITFDPEDEMVFCVSTPCQEAESQNTAAKMEEEIRQAKATITEQDQVILNLELQLSRERAERETEFRLEKTEHKRVVRLERTEHEREIERLKEALETERNRSAEWQRRTSFMVSHNKSCIRGLGLDKDMQGLSIEDFRRQWEQTSQGFVANFGYHNATIACKDANLLVKDLHWQMQSMFASPFGTHTEWFQAVQTLEPAHSTFRVLGAMCMIKLVFETPFPDLDRVGCQKCAATRTIIAGASIQDLETLDIATEHFLYEQSYIQDVLIHQEAQRMVGHLQDWLIELVGDNIQASSNRWTDYQCASYVQCFKKFMDLRMKAVLKREWFYVQWVRHGEAFDPDTMILLEGYTPLGSHVTGGDVKLCLLPALWQCDPPTMNPGSQEFLQPRVSRKSFVPSSSATRKNPECVGRALVVLE